MGLPVRVCYSLLKEIVKFYLSCLDLPSPMWTCFIGMKDTYSMSGMGFGVLGS